MLNPQQFRSLIVVPTLDKIGLCSPVSINLLCGTALAESNLEFIKQVPTGPALSFYQIERTTHDYLRERVMREKDLHDKILACLCMDMLPFEYDYLAGNAYAATIFCRLKYYFDSPNLPEDSENINALAAWWSKYYNSRNLMIDQTRFIMRYVSAYPKS